MKPSNLIEEMSMSLKGNVTWVIWVIKWTQSHESLTIMGFYFYSLELLFGVVWYEISDHMPELQSPTAYPIVWGVMNLNVIGMLVLF